MDVTAPRGGESPGSPGGTNRKGRRRLLPLLLLLTTIPSDMAMQHRVTNINQTYLILAVIGSKTLMIIIDDSIWSAPCRWYCRVEKKSRAATIYCRRDVFVESSSFLVAITLSHISPGREREREEGIYSTVQYSVYRRRDGAVAANHQHSMGETRRPYSSRWDFSFSFMWHATEGEGGCHNRKKKMGDIGRILSLSFSIELQMGISNPIVLYFPLMYIYQHTNNLTLNVWLLSSQKFSIFFYTLPLFNREKRF